MKHLEMEQRLSNRVNKVRAHNPFLSKFPLGGDRDIPIFDGHLAHTINLIIPLTQKEADAVIKHNEAHSTGDLKLIRKTNKKLRLSIRAEHK